MFDISMESLTTDCQTQLLAIHTMDGPQHRAKLAESSARTASEQSAPLIYQKIKQLQPANDEKDQSFVPGLPKLTTEQQPGWLSILLLNL